MEKRYEPLFVGCDLSVTEYTAVETLLESLNKKAKELKIELPTGLMDLRLHDVRRTFGSYQALKGASLQIIGASLGHRSLQSTQIYARLLLSPVKNSIEVATNAMLEFIK